MLYYRGSSRAVPELHRKVANLRQNSLKVAPFGQFSQSSTGINEASRDPLIRFWTPLRPLLEILARLGPPGPYPRSVFKGRKSDGNGGI